MDAARKIALIDRDVLVANKAVLNFAVDLLGRSELQRFAAAQDAIAHASAANLRFRERIGEVGLTATIAERNARFKTITRLAPDRTPEEPHQARTQPDKTAVVTPEGQQIMFGELAARVNRLSRLLRRLGVTEGEHVAFLLGNQPEWFEVALACTQIGAFYTAMNPLLVESEVSHVLKESSARVFIADPAYGSIAARAAELASIPTEARLSVGELDGFRLMSPLAGEESDGSPPGRSMGVSFQYSSGTTGVPKAVNTRVGGSVAAGVQRLTAVALEMDWGAEDVHLVQGFLSSSGPGSYSIATLHLGGKVVLMKKWDAERVLENIERFGVSTSFMVPTMLRRLMQLPANVRHRHRLGSLHAVLVSGAPCSVDLKRAVIDWFGPILFERYGGTELNCSMVNAKDGLAHPDTVGQPFAEVRILDDDFIECEPGGVGTIYLRVDGLPLPEYFNAPEKTANSVHDATSLLAIWVTSMPRVGCTCTTAVST